MRMFVIILKCSVTLIANFENLNSVCDIVKKLKLKLRHLLDFLFFLGKISEMQVSICIPFNLIDVKEKSLEFVLYSF